MASWKAFPFPAADYARDAETLRAQWPRLHLDDAEPLPADAAVLAAWSLFHAGEFAQAARAGVAAGGAGLHVANKAQAVHADYLETGEKPRLALFAEIAERAQAAIARDPESPNAHYWLARALMRTSQGISVAQAQARGLDGRVRSALETTLALAPAHAGAHVALGTFHAEMIDKLGRTAGRGQGADAATALKLFREGIALDPHAAMGRVAYAQGLLMLEGDRRMPEAETLYAEAAAVQPLDARERLEVEIAKEALADE